MDSSNETAAQYYARRAREERRRAEEAVTETAKRSHLDLASSLEHKAAEPGRAHPELN